MNPAASSPAISRLSILFASSLRLQMLSLCANDLRWAEDVEEPGSLSSQVFNTCAAIAISGEAEAGEGPSANEES